MVTKGFKVTNKDLKCIDFQFELNKVFKQSGELKICNNGFHFCAKANHCFNYYNFDSNNRVFEIEAYGDIETENDKSCTLEIKLIREISWNEVLEIVNTGIGNTGHSNTGDRNTGDRNTGNRNTGDRNTGYSNTGDRNTGDRNTGDRNTGDRNTGYSNTGNRNTGYSNTGDRNTGYSNTGDRNTGYSNTGDRNTGYSNTGDRNTGDRNTGDRNTGNRNTGDRNTGNRNTGYSNTGDRNTGAFCTGEAPFPMFNKPSDWTEDDFLSSQAWNLVRNYVDTKMWVNESLMSVEEKQKHYGWQAAGGFIRDIPFKEAFKNAWHNWNQSSRDEFKKLPNFDPEIFEEITGISV